MTAKIRKSDTEWRAELSPLAYEVTRNAATERPFSHPGFAPDAGTLRCQCCGAELFDAAQEFNSGCGWPSFSAPLSANAVEELVDESRGMRRTEVRCAACEAHLGHVFDDGPGPTGLRYCINGVALKTDADPA